VTLLYLNNCGVSIINIVIIYFGPVSLCDCDSKRLCPFLLLDQKKMADLKICEAYNLWAQIQFKHYIKKNNNVKYDVY
jgi:hypothetical protein